VATVWAGAVTAARRGVPGGEPPAGKAPAPGSVRLIAEEQAALRRLAVLVAQGESPEEVLAAVAAEAGRVLHAEQAFIVRYDADSAISVVAAWPSAASVLIPVGTQISGGGWNLTTLVVQTGQPARLDDYASATGAASTVARESGIRASVGAPVSIEGRLWGVMAVTSSEAPLPAGTEERLAAFTELAATAIASAQAREELRSFAAEQAALRRVATLVARGESPEAVFAAVAAEAAQVLHAEHAFIGRYDPGGKFSMVAASSGAAAGFIPVGTRFSTGGRNLITLVLQTGQPARLDDYASATGAIGTWIRESGLRASVGAPVSIEGRLWGVLALISSKGPLPPGTEERLAAFTELAATAIANAQAQAALAASRARIVAAADAARRRIERDLHDGAQQRLVSLALRLRAARAAPPGAGELASWLDGVAAEVTGVLEELREIAHGLHPVILTEGGLRPALRALARRSAVPVSLDVQVAGRLPEPTEIAAYYAVAEALTNTAKHARASVIDVQVESGDGALHVRVRDDGCGGAHVGPGSGLAGLTDRVEALGGRLALDSLPGAGTDLDIVLPLSDPGGPRGAAPGSPGSPSWPPLTWTTAGPELRNLFCRTNRGFPAESADPLMPVTNQIT
jgi:signal transduction histidine kinase